MLWTYANLFKWASPYLLTRLGLAISFNAVCIYTAKMFVGATQYGSSTWQALLVAIAVLGTYHDAIAYANMCLITNTCLVGGFGILCVGIVRMLTSGR